jgi:hypothetical protein
LRGRSVLVDCSEVLKVCSSGALARSRYFLEFRMIEARMGLESQKGHLFDNLDARSAIVGLAVPFTSYSNLCLLRLTLSLTDNALRLQSSYKASAVAVQEARKFGASRPIDLPLLYCELLILPSRKVDYFDSSWANSEIMNLSVPADRG